MSPKSSFDSIGQRTERQLNRNLDRYIMSLVLLSLRPDRPISISSIVPPSSNHRSPIGCLRWRPLTNVASECRIGEIVENVRKETYRWLICLSFRSRKKEMKHIIRTSLKDPSLSRPFLPLLLEIPNVHVLLFRPSSVTYSGWELQSSCGR